MSPRRGFAVRRAERRDLDALVELEKGFPGDRMSRASLSRLLGRESAVVLVAESGGEVIGDAVVLFRSGFRSARLYSMIVSPEHRGRGVARALLAEAEAAARERGSVSLRLEVREDNRPAIALYESEGYEAVGAAPAYYEDGGGAIRMVKRFLPGSSTLLGVPFYGQTLDFTCGPACLMMAMRHHGYPVPLERWLELTLWREATTVFMTSGHGGCSAHGLAVAALRRGFQATVVTRDAGVPFLDSVRSEAKKEVIALAHETFEREIKALGGRVEVRNFGVDDVVAAVDRGAVPIVLVSGYRLYAEKAPHWIVVTGYDDENVYVHDPIVFEPRGRLDSVNLALRRADFDRISVYGKARHRSLLLVERWGRVSRRLPDER
ncbi:MAG TPA: peptidase C39 family protein [Trueperaceae bacterium]|nr:peptidase C39 family protein [Trueperaceae bacterium]